MEHNADFVDIERLAITTILEHLVCGYEVQS